MQKARTKWEAEGKRQRQQCAKYIASLTLRRNQQETAKKRSSEALLSPVLLNWTWDVLCTEALLDEDCCFSSFPLVVNNTGPPD